MPDTSQKLTREQKIELLDQFYASGLTQAEFVRKLDRSDVGASAFGYWVQEDRKKWRPQPGERIAAAVAVKDREAVTKNPYPSPEVAQEIIRNLQVELEQERAKVESLNKVILVLGYQL